MSTMEAKKMVKQDNRERLTEKTNKCDILALHRHKFHMDEPSYKRERSS